MVFLKSNIQKNFKKRHKDDNDCSSYCRRNNGKIIVEGSKVLDNQWIFVYNLVFCQIYNYHINTKVCFIIIAIKYLY
uniref:Uncharacterized protein n=1 Tax=Physcomitrium patens TaxID=3218 RepID=A0A2K1JXD0_PHYPA|nr:hypothetical protein PHYPA_013303 [Physcomitrium patens]